MQMILHPPAAVMSVDKVYICTVGHKHYYLYDGAESLILPIETEPYQSGFTRLFDKGTTNIQQDAHTHRHEMKKTHLCRLNLFRYLNYNLILLLVMQCIRKKIRLKNIQILF